MSRIASTRAVLDGLFRPRSVAVFGSASAGKLGHTVVRNLRAWGFDGAIYPINREGAAIDGFPGYASLDALPEPPECAMLVVPAAHCLEIVEQCAAAGVRFAVIGASGFGELATAGGVERQHAIAAVARASGMRLVGPNTNGIFNATDGFSLGYNAAHGERMTPGSVSIVSHSGALFDGIADRLQRAGNGLSKFVPAGNEADLTMLDFLEYLIDDAVTRVIGLVIEGLDDGARFRELAFRARRAGKPIVALKIGRSDAGAGAALAHSSRLAGATRAYDALLRESGVASVTTVEALASGCALLANYPVRRDRFEPNIVVVTSSGAGGALVADVANDRGLELAATGGEWDEPLATGLASLGTAARIRNPIDLGTLGNWQLLSNVFGLLRGHADGPVVVYAHNAPRAVMGEELADALIERVDLSPAPVLVLSPGGLRHGVEDRLVAHRIPVFHDTATCFDALMCYYQSAEQPSMLDVPAPAIPVCVPAGVELVRARLATGAMLSETESADILRSYGAPIVESVEVAGEDDALRAAARIGFPLVLKALPPGVAHKFAGGYVRVGIASEGELRAEYASMEQRIEAAGFVRSAVPLVLQPMLAGDLELIAGVSYEAGLGHFLVFGTGGVHAELFDDVTLLPLPLDARRIVERVRSARVGRLLERMQRPGDDLGARFAGVLDALQNFTADHGECIASVDLNPLLVTAAGLVAVDALVVPR
jgi:acyl-CoA synthetase (NDP forming)